MADPFVGQILAVGFNYAPIGWLPCDGRILAISEYYVLFALIGTTYGGDGANTFAVPNLNGRIALGAGQGPNRSNHFQGEVGGSESVTLVANQVGGHNHGFLASGQGGTTNIPGPTQALAVNPQTAASLYAAPPATAAMSPNAIAATGNGGPHENRQPFTVINYIICTEGVFPPQG